MGLWNALLLMVIVCVFPNEGARCQLGFVPHKHSCYWFSNEKGSFAEATAVCRYLKSRLAEINNRDEDEFVTGHIKRHGKSPYYLLGGTDLRLEGRFTWEGQVTPMVYQNWYPGQPSNWGGQENCMGIDKTMAYKWNDWPCKDSHNFVCEN
ncbi:perlucin-like [Haliotis cracherodii]|uniref:perlucin-like n=1 Tax=Haliotis rufescens TaxID=6454 RepID=UPI00201F5FC4|nr:perlucin-like [Haliotis rufescens]